MQGTSSRSLTEVFLALAIPVAGALGVLLRSLWEQKAPLTLALADKARAEARVADSEILDKAWERIDQLEKANRELAGELYAERAGCIEARTKVETQEVELKLQARDIKKLRAILTLNNLKYSDYDHVGGDG